MEIARATAGALALVLSLSTPAFAFFGPIPVIDPASIAQEVATLAKEAASLEQTIILVKNAGTNLRQLDGGISLTNLTDRLSAATSLIQNAEAVCASAMNGRTPPAACSVRANVAQSQVGKLSGSLATLSSLQAATRGSIGGLQAQQASAHALVEVATQLQQLHQLSLADATQKAIDDKAITHALTTPPDYDPWK